MNRWRSLTYEEMVGRVRTLGFLLAGLVLSGAGAYEAVRQLTAPPGKFELTRFVAAIVLAGVLPYGVLLSILGLSSSSNGKKE